MNNPLNFDNLPMHVKALFCLQEMLKTGVLPDQSIYDVDDQSYSLLKTLNNQQPYILHEGFYGSDSEVTESYLLHYYFNNGGVLNCLNWPQKNLQDLLNYLNNYTTLINKFTNTALIPDVIELNSHKLLKEINEYKYKVKFVLSEKIPSIEVTSQALIEKDYWSQQNIFNIKLKNIAEEVILSGSTIDRNYVISKLEKYLIADKKNSHIVTNSINFFIELIKIWENPSREEWLSFLTHYIENPCSLFCSSYLFIEGLQNRLKEFNFQSHEFPIESKPLKIDDINHLYKTINRLIILNKSLFELLRYKSDNIQREDIVIVVKRYSYLFDNLIGHFKKSKTYAGQQRIIDGYLALNINSDKETLIKSFRRIFDDHVLYNQLYPFLSLGFDQEILEIKDDLNLESMNIS